MCQQSLHDNANDAPTVRTLLLTPGLRKKHTRWILECKLGGEIKLQGLTLYMFLKCVQSNSENKLEDNIKSKKDTQNGTLNFSIILPLNRDRWKSISQTTSCVFFPILAVPPWRLYYHGNSGNSTKADQQGEIRTRKWS